MWKALSEHHFLSDLFHIKQPSSLCIHLRTEGQAELGQGQGWLAVPGLQSLQALGSAGAGLVHEAH